MSLTTLPPPQPVDDPADSHEATESDRWRPTRAGLIALWRFWDETFSFHNGRLLLRGPNGSGKSMALELLLPFLLDANASPHRLTSAAKSRGGLYERIMTGADTTNRAGYAWIEFRRGPDAFTVGVRLRASASTRKVDSDFFTTTLTVGDDLHLLDDQRVPLSRQALVDAIGTTGRVHNSGADHRMAVADTLFPGFGPDRYDSVISALLALRKEKLSQNLDVPKLSEILSEALPPLDEHDLATVAEGFERLDRRREELAQLEADVREVSRLGARQRTYARALVAAHSDDVRRAESTRDDVTRREREARAELADTSEQIEKLAAEQREVAGQIRSTTVAILGLRDSDVVRQGRDLDAERQLVKSLAAGLERAEAAHANRSGEDQTLRDELEVAERRATTARSNLETVDHDLRTLTDRVGGQRVVGEAHELFESTGQASVFTSMIGAWIDDRRTSISAVRAALVDHADAIRSRDAVATKVEAEVSDVEDAVDTERSADSAVAVGLDEFASQIASWVTSASTLGVDTVRAAVSMPVDEDDEIERLRSAVVRLRTSWSADVGSRRERLARATSELDEDERSLVSERDELAAGRVLRPPMPEWRSDRTVSDGAPLWWLVDAGSGDESAALDGIEAALGASGLLDAWIHPDGSVDVDTERFDIVLGDQPVTGASLADVLVAASPDGGTQELRNGGSHSVGDDVAFGRVDVDVVTTVLRSVPIATHVGTDDGSSGVIVGRDGSFRIGAAVGRAPVLPARYLGAGARERRRLERLAELNDALADVARRRTDLAAERADLDRHDDAVRAELDAAPTGRDLVEARSKLREAQARLADARLRLDRSRRELSAADDRVRAALRELTNVGARLGLPTSAPELDALSTSIDDLHRSVDTWGRRHEELTGQLAQLDAARTRSQRAADALVTAIADVERASRELADANGRLKALTSMIGRDYQDALDQIDVLEVQQRDAELRGRELADQRPPLDKRLGALEGTVAAAESERTVAEERRTATHQRFVRLLGDGLADDAEVKASASDVSLDGVTNVLATARAIADELGDIDRTPAAIDRVANRVVERLHETQSLLAGRVDFVREQSDDGWWTLRGVTGGVRRRVSELVVTLEHDLDETRGELDADEEELFEQVLAGDIRRSLAERIRGANRLLDDINAQLGKVVTEAGRVAVRLRWDVDPDQPASIAKARRLLLQDPAGLDAEQSAALRDFVKSRIEEARAQLETNAPWDARLRETLDYRAWHRFGLEISHRDWEGYKPATPSVLQRLSTGERSIALHLPMLASIAAHYAVATRGGSDAPATCPRLVLLDELFAGVDPTNRAQLFATFTRWDLDAVFTSDHEWCQYADLDGIAIHQLHPTVDDEPVTSTRFTWDGHRRTADPPK